MDAPETFRRRVIAVVRRIPSGRVATYGDVADAAGYPRPARAVGNVMTGCNTPDVPCHRVVAADGLGGYSGGDPGHELETKRWLLENEGALPPALV